MLSPCPFTNLLNMIYNGEVKIHTIFLFIHSVGIDGFFNVVPRY